MILQMLQLAPNDPPFYDHYFCRVSADSLDATSLCVSCLSTRIKLLFHRTALITRVQKPILQDRGR